MTNIPEKNTIYTIKIIKYQFRTKIILFLFKLFYGAYLGAVFLKVFFSYS